MSDLISRQAALDAVEKAATKECARWAIKELPPVWHDVQSAEAIYKVEEGDGMALRASAEEGMWRELASSYERTIVKLTEAIAAQAQNEGAKMT